ncbi:hypothetical protein [Lacticaseibacillus chiayiensis]|uniref:hypothetical protein n=1 Tax=Lacticaseibacillus chiayiensis TaxID=2100821 RepID=UPI0010114738|nr:hypothetical protein [Lacticaseibacillus chiayiensis]RXT59380.1 hypothetical protein CHT97_00005 [Lacticaseibacillus chiayiensis]
MARKILKYQSLLLTIGGFAINLVPFLLFMLLINRHGELITNVLPFALFYSFRRTSLFMFRGNPNQNYSLGRLGLSSALIGYTIGIFGQLSPICWDISAIGAGIGAALFPSVQKESVSGTANTNNQDKVPHSTLMMLIAILILIGIIAFTEKRFPFIGFILMIVYSIFGLLGFHFDPSPKSTNNHISIRYSNVLLSFALFVSVILVRVARSEGIGTPALLGVAILGTILIITTLLLVNTNHTNHTITNDIRVRLMVFGTCADFCAIFSAIYIGVKFGVTTFMWIIVAYLAAFIFASPMVTVLQRRFQHTSSLTIDLIGIFVGLLLTFILPLYFVGIFLIRLLLACLTRTPLTIMSIHRLRTEITPSW